MHAPFERSSIYINIFVEINSLRITDGWFRPYATFHSSWPTHVIISIHTSEEHVCEQFVLKLCSCFCWFASWLSEFQNSSTIKIQLPESNANRLPLQSRKNTVWVWDLFYRWERNRSIGCIRIGLINIKGFFARWYLNFGSQSNTSRCTGALTLEWIRTTQFSTRTQVYISLEIFHDLLYVLESHSSYHISLRILNDLLSILESHSTKHIIISNITSTIPSYNA